MGYQKVLAPHQDESSDFIKKLYVCEADGCGWYHEKATQFCADHKTKESRKEVEAEYDLLTSKT